MRLQARNEEGAVIVGALSISQKLTWHYLILLSKLPLQSRNSMLQREDMNSKNLWNGLVSESRH